MRQRDFTWLGLSADRSHSTYRSDPSSSFPPDTVVLSTGLLWFGVTKSIQFKRGCSGHLKRAAAANTIQLAEIELAQAVGYVETNQLSSGDTSVLYSLPENELDFWYENLKASLAELQATCADADRLSVSNQLIKLRETIMDRGEKRSRVTVPPNAFVFPHQVVYRGLGLAAVTGMLIGGAGWIGGLECSTQSCES